MDGMVTAPFLGLRVLPEGLDWEFFQDFYGHLAEVARSVGVDRLEVASRANPYVPPGNRSGSIRVGQARALDFAMAGAVLRRAA